MNFAGDIHDKCHLTTTRLRSNIHAYVFGFSLEPKIVDLTRTLVAG